jgi:hypothetical protein
MTAAGWRGLARGLNGGRDGGGERLGDAWQLLSDNSIPRGSHATEVSREGCARRTSKGYAEASDDASLSHNRPLVVQAASGIFPAKMPGLCEVLSLRSGDCVLSRTFVMVKGRAVKVACAVLRGRGGSNTALLTGGSGWTSTV